MLRSMASDTESHLLQLCTYGSLCALKDLITKQGLNPNEVKDSSGFTLHLACQHGHLDIVQYLIKDQNCNPEPTTPKGCTPLHTACKSGHLLIVKCLITDHKCNPHCTDNDGYTPLHAASESGNIETVKYLITEQGCDPNAGDSIGNIPLHYASESGHLHIVQHLITNFNSDPNMMNSRGSIPLHYACRGGQTTVARYLIDEHQCSPNCTNMFGNTSLHLACLNSCLPLVKYLIEEHVCNAQSVNNNGLIPLHYACLNGHLDITKYLILVCNCNPQCSTNNGNTPLHFACQNGHLEVVKHLITEYKCSPEHGNVNGYTPLHSAASSGHLTVVKCLICELCCNPQIADNAGYTPLHFACLNGHLDITKYLISDCKCDPQYSASNGNTPLHYACLNGHLDITKYLILVCNCNPQCSTNNGNTPLHFACQNGHLEVVKHLITEYKCSPEHGNVNGYTPLHSAASSGHLTVVKCLICELCCNPQIADNAGYTPLHFACLNGHLDITKYLISDCNCNPQHSTNRGNTPLHYACQNGHLEVVKHLITEYKCSPEHGNVNGYTPLHSAASSGHLTVVKCLICELCCNPQIADNAGYTPLHFACLNGHLDITKYLISDCNCNPQHSTNRGNTPLHYACENGHLEVAKYLITEYKCSPEHGNVYGYTPLHSATSNGHLDIVKYLISQHNCNPQCRDNDDSTPLHEACSSGHLNIAEYLIEEKNCACEPMAIINDEMLAAATKREGFPLQSSLMVKAYETFLFVKYMHGWTTREIATSKAIEGITPLHFACMKGHLDTVKYLISTCKCNPNHATSNGFTAIDFAQICKHKEVVSYLRNEHQCSSSWSQALQANPFDFNFSYCLACNDEMCISPLQQACIIGDLETVKSCITKSDSNPSSAGLLGLTPLHTACMMGHLEIAKYLVFECKCDPNCAIVGTTPQTISITPHYQNTFITPLTVATAWGQLDIIKWLVSELKCNPECNENDFPLDILACMFGQLDVLKYLLHESGFQDLPGLLFAACCFGDLNIVKYLIDECKCDPHFRSGDGAISLHFACSDVQHLFKNKNQPSEKITTSNLSINGIILHIWQAIIFPVTMVTQLVRNLVPGFPNPAKQTNNYDILSDAMWPNRKNRSGEQFKNPKLDIVNYLITEHKCNPQCTDKEGQTPLHYACASGQHETVQYFHTEKLSDLVHTAHSGDTPLHFACKYNHAEVVQFLLSTGECDPLIKNVEGLTPVEFATSPEIRNLLDHFCKGKYPLGSVVKVFVLGDPMAGKSSLVQAIQSNPGFLSSLIGRFKKVKGARQQTVGIDSVSFSSSDFGNVVIYDFAGQREFYTSHAAFLQSYSFHMEGIFIVVTDITHCEDDISQSLQYWVSFIQDCCTHSKIKPHVIFVGSHVDQLDLGSIERVINTIEQNFSVNNFYETEAIICLDCTQPASPQLDLLRYHLEESCDAIREKTEKIDQRCYVLHKYVLKAYINKGVSGCRLKTFSKELEGNPYLLPSNPSELLSLFKTLHDKGQVLLLRNDHDISDSWVITNIAALLETVVGSIFAPRDFPQHIAPGSTGIVPKSRMSEAFPDFNIDMVIGFLEHFEFCHRVEPECDSLSNQTMSDDEYYLFPALLTSEEIPHILQENYESSYCCGWFMYSAVGQFFTTRFLHVLLVRLAFLFAPPQVDATPSRIKVPALRRRCKMWKNGISWPDTNGVIVVFELKDLKTATLRMTCMKGREIHCVRLHTSLIRAILKTKNEFCPRVHVEECIMDVTPGNLTAVLECPSYSIRYLSAVIASRHSQGDPDLVLTNSDGSTGKRISELLYFEPYAVLTAELIKQLFAKDNTKKLVSSSFITELACRMYPFNDSLEQVLTPDPSILSRMYKEHHLEILGELYRQQLRCQRILEAWVEQLGPAATYKKLRQELNEYSIFCGRNPLFLVSTKFIASEHFLSTVYEFS